VHFIETTENRRAGLAPASGDYKPLVCNQPDCERDGGKGGGLVDGSETSPLEIFRRNTYKRSTRNRKSLVEDGG